MITPFTYLQLSQIEDLVGPDKKMRRQVYIALGKASQSLKRKMVKQVYEQVKVPQKIIRKTVYIAEKPTLDALRMGVGLRRSGKISLKYFKAKQLATTRKKVSKRLKRKVYKETGRTRVALKKRALAKQGGVTYTISRQGKKGFVASGFQGPTPERINTKWNGHAFKRMTKARKPIGKLHGPSPWGVYTNKKLRKPAERYIRKEVRKQLKLRVRYLKLRAKNKLRGKQPKTKD